MLLQHSVRYLLARGIPGVINFFAIAIYTRLLVPEAYGHYTLVLSGVGLLNVVIFQWLRLSVLRYLSNHKNAQEELLSTVLSSFVVLVILTGASGVGVALLGSERFPLSIIISGILLLWGQGWLDLCLEIFRARLEPNRYGYITSLKSVASLLLGVTFIHLGLGAYGPLLGLLVGLIITGWMAFRNTFSGVPVQLHREQLRVLLRFGLPLTATFALSFVVSSSDRFLIAAFLGQAATGQYAASYDLAQQTLTLLMMIVNLAAYPLVVEALEKKGAEAARRQLRDNATLLLAIAFPASLGIAMLAPNIATVLLGKSFHVVASELLPIISLATLLAGTKAYYFDLAFQLSQWTSGQLWISLVVAVTNVLLNVYLIPSMGVLGAAIATLLAYVLGLFMSAIVGRKIFFIPIPWKESGQLLLASGIMATVLISVRNQFGVVALIGQCVLGVVIYGLCILALDVRGIRRLVLAFLRGRIQLNPRP